MKTEKLDYMPILEDFNKVKLTTMGNVIEESFSSSANRQPTIKRLPNDKYVVLSTGEIKDCSSSTNRGVDKISLYRTFKKIRELVNTNVVDTSKCRWCTLTYAENMTDTKRLYIDFDSFRKRFNRYLTKIGLSVPEYISVAEPQARGAWHLHIIWIWNTVAPFIPNKQLAELWLHGFVNIKKLDTVDNVGAYLTAYLGDVVVPYDDTLKGSKTVEIDGQKKSVVKGGRLHLYPPSFNILRHSRGIKKPVVEYMTHKQAQKKVLGATKTFEQAYMLTLDDDKQITVTKVQYNRCRSSCQE